LLRRLPRALRREDESSMLTDDVLLRLSQLNRGDVPLVATQTPAQRAAPAVEDILPAAGQGEDVARLPSGCEVVNRWGKHYLRERSLEDLWPHGAHWLSRELVRLDEARATNEPRARDLQAFLNSLPAHVMLLDLETCGFAGSPIFLAGVLHEEAGRWKLSQLLARNYAEEKALLQSLWSVAADKRVLVTFNGKSFDWPMVHDRSTRHHLGEDPRDGGQQPGDAAPQAPVTAALERHDPRPALMHCDLLHHARRRWGKQLPDCRLQTLERQICRRRREEDIPGHAIPAAYHDFVRTGDAWLMRSVLHHNALDLITLLQLAMLVAQ
jgi:uncharacterized protein YprB with RNaseH-like and TPR domain